MWHLRGGNHTDPGSKIITKKGTLEALDLQKSMNWCFCSCG